MTATTFSQLSALHKVLYPYGMETILQQECVLLGRMAKANNFVGEAITVPIKYGPGNKVGPVFADTQTDTTNSSRAKFLLTTSYPLYGTVQIEGRAIRRSKDAGVITDVVKDETKSVLYGMAQRAGQIMYGNGGGAIGQISVNADPVITLSDPGALASIEVGYILYPSTADGTSGAIIADPGTVTDLDRISGEITLDAAAVGNWAVNNYVFAKNTFGAVATGIGGYVPAANPSATTFRNVDRTADLVRLSGTRLTATGTDATIARALVRLVSTVGRFTEAKEFEIYVSPDVFERLVLELEDKTYIEKMAKNSDGTEGKVGYMGLSIVCGNKRATVFADTYCPRTVAWCLDMSSWKIHAVPGGFPGIINEDGNSNLRMSTVDGFEWRYVMEWDLACNNPGANGRMDLSALL